MASLKLTAALAVGTAQSRPARPVAAHRTASGLLPGHLVLLKAHHLSTAYSGAATSAASLKPYSLTRANVSAGVDAGVAAVGDDKDKYVEILHRAAEEGSVPRMEVFKAMMSLEKMKLPADGLLDAVTAEGKRWRLVYTAGKEPVTAAIKAKGSHSELTQAGQYFPLTAVQTWDGSNNRIENGVYLGFLASLKFSGPFYMHEKKLNFDFTKLALSLGPFKPEFNIKNQAESTAEFKRIAEAKGKGAQSPFFLFTYADDKIAIARGKGGGIAMWAAASPAWLMKSGVV